MEIRYPLGFERMVRAAVHNFKKIGLQPVLRPYSISLNKQFTYDHKEDRGLWLDKALIERGLEVDRTVWEKHKAIAPNYGGPAVIEIFGQSRFRRSRKRSSVTYTDKQRETECMSAREEPADQSLHSRGGTQFYDYCLPGSVHRRKIRRNLCGNGAYQYA